MAIRKNLFALTAAAYCVVVAVSGLAFADALTAEGQPCPPECVTDTMEIVTWYPSPYNEYEELRLYPTQRGPADCDNYKIGLMYYDDGGTPSFAENDKIRVCKGDLGWQELSYWQLLGTDDIYNTNSGNVGIGTGTASPGAKLEVVGGIKVGDDTAVCDDTAKAGIMRYNAGAMQYCDGSAWKPLGGGGAAHGKMLFTASDTFTVPVGVTTVWVSMSGGGGGGGRGSSGAGAGGGGGGAAVIAQAFSVSSEEDIAVTIGSGGPSGPSSSIPSNGGSGGLSSFGGYTTPGGGGGRGSSGAGSGSGGSSGGAGGSSGGAGSGGSSGGAGFPVSGGSGGGSIFGSGGGGGGGSTPGSPGSPGGNYGGGGGGGAAGSGPGTGAGSGAPGFVLVEW